MGKGFVTIILAMAFVLILAFTGEMPAEELLKIYFLALCWGKLVHIADKLDGGRNG